MKQILLINDIVGHSKVGMAAMLPILSYMGIPVYNLPTALVSNTLDYGAFAEQDTTDYMRRVFPVWKQLGFRYDAICTGLMFSEEQARLIANYCGEQAAQGTIVFVDPIMGDAGRLYNGMTQRQVELMRQMVSVAHLSFPNYTEACYLTDTPYQPEGISRQEASQLMRRMVTIGSHSVLITSCIIDRRHHVCGYNHNDGQEFFLEYEEIPGLFHGTGDIFSAVLIGHLLKDEPLCSSTRIAMDVVSQMISRNRHQKDKCVGLPIEQCLDLL